MEGGTISGCGTEAIHQDIRHNYSSIEYCYGCVPPCLHANYLAWAHRVQEHTSPLCPDNTFPDNMEKAAKTLAMVTLPHGSSTILTKLCASI